MMILLSDLEDVGKAPGQQKVAFLCYVIAKAFLGRR